MISTTGFVFTIAGSKTGDGGSYDGFGTGSLFNLPRGIAVSTSGSVYVADYINVRVRVVNTKGG
jgi:hypothetical protein